MLRLLTLLLLFLAALQLHAQTVPDFRGQEYEEVSTWCRSNKYSYARVPAPDTTKWTLEVILDKKEIAAGSSLAKAKVLLLTFDANSICIDQEQDSRTVEIRMNEKKAVAAPANEAGTGMEFRKAALHAASGNALLVVGTSLTTLALLQQSSGSSTLLAAGGGLMTVAGLVYNTVAWRRVMLAGSKIGRSR